MTCFHSVIFKGLPMLSCLQRSEYCKFYFDKDIFHTGWNRKLEVIWMKAIFWKQILIKVRVKECSLPDSPLGVAWRKQAELALRFGLIINTNVLSRWMLRLLDPGPFKKKWGVVQPDFTYISCNNVLNLCLSVGPDALFSFWFRNKSHTTGIIENIRP